MPMEREVVVYQRVLGLLKLIKFRLCNTSIIFAAIIIDNHQFTFLAQIIRLYLFTNNIIYQTYAKIH